MKNKKDIKIPAHFLTAIDRIHASATEIFHSLDEKALELAGTRIVNKPTPNHPKPKN